MLKVPPDVVPVKRELLHIVARKWYAYPFGKTGPDVKRPANISATLHGRMSGTARGYVSRWFAIGIGLCPFSIPAGAKWFKGDRFDGRDPRIGQGDVNVLKDFARGDAKATFGGFDEIVAGFAGVFAAESVDENHAFRESTSAHEKTGAVDSPILFTIHFVVPLGGGLFEQLLVSCEFMF